MRVKAPFKLKKVESTYASGKPQSIGAAQYIFYVFGFKRYQRDDIFCNLGTRRAYREDRGAYGFRMREKLTRRLSSVPR